MNNLIRTFVYLLIGIFPFGLLLRFKVWTNVYITPQDVIVFFIFLLLSIHFIVNKKWPEFKNFYLFQILFLLTGAISLVVNASLFKDINIAVSLLYLFRYISYLSLLSIGPFFIDSKFIRKAIFVSGAAFLIFGFLQFIFFNDLRTLFYLGWDEHLYRLFSTIFDPNFAGLIYVLLFFMFFYNITKKTLRYSYIEFVLSAFTLLAVYLTFSRTALVAFMAGALALSVMHKKVKLLLIGMVALFLLLITVSDTSIEGLNPLRTVSTKERITSMIETGRIIAESPIIGVGFNAFRYAQVRYGMRQDIGASISNSDAGTDNSILFVAATTGFVGLTFYVISIFFLIKKLLHGQNLRPVIASLLISLFVGSMFINALFYTPVLILIFLIFGLRKRLF